MTQDEHLDEYAKFNDPGLDPLLVECQKDIDAERVEQKDTSIVEWITQKMAEISAGEAAANAEHAVLQERINEGRDAKLRLLERSREYLIYKYKPEFAEQLLRAVKEAPGKAQSIATGYGRAGLRKTAARDVTEITNEDEVLKYLQLNLPPAVKKTIIKSKLTEALSDGEDIPGAGLVRVPGKTTIYAGKTNIHEIVEKGQ